MILVQGWTTCAAFERKAKKLSGLSKLHINDCRSRLRMMTLDLFNCFRRPKGRNRRFIRNQRPRPHVPSAKELENAVVNLSPTPLSKDHKLLLYKGLGFAIQPAEFDRKAFLESFRNLKYQVTKKVGKDNHQTKAFCERLSQDMQNIRVSRSTGNLSKAERACLKELQENDDIVIKPADKGRAVVVWDKQMYVAEMERQLSDGDTYARWPSDKTKEYERDIACKLNEMEVEGLISAQLADDLRPHDSRTPPMYGLPKIHKLLPPIRYGPDIVCKARPIIGACGCPTERISAYVDDHIRPLAQNVPSYLRDTTHFLQRLASLQQVPDGTLLVTADVASLYPSIPQPDGLEALRRALNKRDRLVPPTEALVRLADLVLSCNHFTFNGQYYTQTSGTAMGTRFAPNYAILFMDDFESELLNASELRPECWWRYIDDVFFVWTHGEAALLEFIRLCNDIQPAIQLTFDYSISKVNFLDVSVMIEKGRVVTDLYRKPTDTLQYLHFDSCHPVEQQVPIAYSQALRIRKICSRKSDAEQHCRELRNALLRRGYPRGPISRHIQKALGTDRQALIWPSSAKKEDPVKMVIPFHPDVSKMSEVIRARSSLLDGTDVPPIKVYWKPPKRLKSILVSSHLRSNSTQGNAARGDRVIGGTTRCGRSRCLTCPMVSGKSTVTSSITGLTYPTPKATCISTKVIYLLSFDGCNHQYVGQTKNKLSLRMNLYRSAFYKKATDQPAIYHMVEEHKHHEWEDLRVTVLQLTNTEQELADAEFHWISQLMTDYPFGLNIQHVLYRNCFTTMEDLKQ
jgi:hypothetical protein